MSEVRMPEQHSANAFMNLLSGEGGAQIDKAASLRLKVLEELATALTREVEALKERQQPDVTRHISLIREVRQFEVNLILSALAHTNGHQTRAAQLLGVKITTLNAKIKRYRIDPESCALLADASARAA